ncbi:hypothetical protein Hanom_Chr09g00802711 [Helianthus anomalus]
MRGSPYPTASVDSQNYMSKHIKNNNAFNKKYIKSRILYPLLFVLQPEKLNGISYLHHQRGSL